MRERGLDIFIWHVTRMGGWLHVATAIVALCKAAGLWDPPWLVVFAPSLLYGASMIFLFLLGHALYALCRWINSPDVPADSYTRPIVVRIPRGKKAA